jgi:hypothetical protein
MARDTWAKFPLLPNLPPSQKRKRKRISPAKIFMNTRARADIAIARQRFKGKLGG